MKALCFLRSKASPSEIQGLRTLVPEYRGCSLRGQSTRTPDPWGARIVGHPLPWKTTTLNHIWVNRFHRGEALAVPCIRIATTIAVESGPGRTGKWVEEKRSFLEDDRRYLGNAPPKVGATAIMTEKDDVGEEASVWYDPIKILTTPSRQRSKSTLKPPAITPQESVGFPHI
jgi:hypothetical protein